MKNIKPFKSMPDIPLPRYAVKTLESPELSYNLSMIPQEEKLQKSIETDTNTGHISINLRWVKSIIISERWREQEKASNLYWEDLKMIKVKLPTLRFRVTERFSPKWRNSH